MQSIHIFLLFCFHSVVESFYVTHNFHKLFLIFLKHLIEVANRFVMLLQGILRELSDLTDCLKVDWGNFTIFYWDDWRVFLNFPFDNALKKIFKISLINFKRSSNFTSPASKIEWKSRQKQFAFQFYDYFNHLNFSFKTRKSWLID